MPTRNFVKRDKPKGGPKPYQIDPNEVFELARIGCTPDEIAAILSPPGKAKLLSANHLEKRFHAVISKGRMELHRSLKHELVSRALNGNTAALIFALKAYCKLSENEPQGERNHLTIHFDYGQARKIEERAVPVREAVRDMLAGYRKDFENTTAEDVMEVDSTPLLTDTDSDTVSDDI